MKSLLIAIVLSFGVESFSSSIEDDNNMRRTCSILKKNYNDKDILSKQGANFGRYFRQVGYKGYHFNTKVTDYELGFFQLESCEYVKDYYNKKGFHNMVSYVFFEYLKKNGTLIK